MVKKIINNKIFKFSSITGGSLINTFCSEDVIVLNEYSYITVDGYRTSLEGFELKKNENKIETRNDLLEYFLSKFSDLEFNDVDNGEDEDNGKKLDDIFKLKQSFANKKLLISNINGMFKESFNDDESDKKKILDNVFKNKELCLTLKTESEVEINCDDCYKLNNEFQKKLEEVNKEIETYFNIGQIKSLMQKKGFEKAKISINDGKYEFEDDVICGNRIICVDYKDNINNYLKPKTAEIESIAGDGLILDKNVKKYKIDFLKDSITKE